MHINTVPGIHYFEFIPCVRTYSTRYTSINHTVHTHTCFIIRYDRRYRFKKRKGKERRRLKIESVRLHRNPFPPDDGYYNGVEYFVNSEHNIK